VNLALEKANESIQAYALLDDEDPSKKAQLDGTIAYFKTCKLRGHAEAALALFDKKPDPVVAAGVVAAEESSGTIDPAAKKTKKKDTLKPREPSLLERLDSYEPGNPHRQHNLVQIPPGFEPMPCNPIFLDLAAPDFPDLSHRCGEKKDGGPNDQQQGWLSWLTG
jgi:hypothetical protein